MDAVFTPCHRIFTGGQQRLFLSASHQDAIAFKAVVGQKLHTEHTHNFCSFDSCGVAMSRQVDGFQGLREK